MTSPAAPVATTATPARSFDVAAVKAQFPILSRLIDRAPLHYLDSANTSQKPRAGPDVDGSIKIALCPSVSACNP